MRIGVDAHVLSEKFQGSRTYLLNLYKAVLAQAPAHEFTFYGQWNGEQVFGRAAVYKQFPSRSRWKRLAVDTRKLAVADRLELFHSTYIAPLNLPCRSLVTVHDVIFETMPEYFSKFFVWRSRLLVKRSARQAEQIHTISQFTKDLISSIYSIPTDHVHLVPPGIDLTVFHPEGRKEDREIICKKYGITDFVLTVGRLEPRKNHIGLLEAYSKVKAKNRSLGRLVIVGQRDFGYDGFLNRITELRLQDDVMLLPDVSDDILPQLYRAARLFVYPSFAEGFGIPVLEAMACGTATIASNTSAIPEVVGNGGVLVDPGNTDMIAEAMLTLLESPSMADDLANRAVGIAKEWTWDKAASKYLKSIEMLGIE